MYPLPPKNNNGHDCSLGSNTTIYRENGDENPSIYEDDIKYRGSMQILCKLSIIVDPSKLTRTLSIDPVQICIKG